MTQSTYKDIDGDYFPDPSTINYNNVEASNVTTIELTELTCNKFWALLPTLFDAYEYDDILLSLNRIPHKNMLKPGSVLFSPTREDIEGTLSNEN